jgi:hypothetical protein
VRATAWPRSWFLPIIAVALVLRIVVCFVVGLPSSSADTPFYINEAAGLRLGLWSPMFPVGYPILIAAAMSIARDHLAGALLVLNVLMSTATVVFVGLSAEKLTSTRAGIVAAGITAIWPQQLNFVRLVLSEVLSTFFLTASAAFTCRSFDVFGGLALSGAILTRTIYGPVAPLAVALLTRDARRRAVRFGIGVAVPIAIVAAISYSRVGGVRLGNNLATNIIIAHRSTGNQVDFHDTTLTTTAASRIYVSGSMAHPVFFVKQRVLALWELWGPWPAGDESRGPHTPARSRAVRALLGIRFPLLVLALWSLPMLGRSLTVVYLWLPIVTVTIVHTVLFATPRFTVPVEPLLIVLAVCGLDARMRSRVVLR